MENMELINETVVTNGEELATEFAVETPNTTNVLKKVGLGIVITGGVVALGFGIKKLSGKVVTAIRNKINERKAAKETVENEEVCE